MELDRGSELVDICRTAIAGGTQEASISMSSLTRVSLSLLSPTCKSDSPGVGEPLDTPRISSFASQHRFP